MQVKGGEVKIFYNVKDIDIYLDEALENLLKEFGFEFWASGYSIEDGTRDLAFEKRKGWVE